MFLLTQYGLLVREARARPVALVQQRHEPVPLPVLGLVLAPARRRAARDRLDEVAEAQLGRRLAQRHGRVVAVRDDAVERGRVLVAADERQLADAALWREKRGNRTRQCITGEQQR